MPATKATLLVIPASATAIPASHQCRYLPNRNPPPTPSSPTAALIPRKASDARTPKTRAGRHACQDFCTAALYGAGPQSLPQQELLRAREAAARLRSRRRRGGALAPTAFGG